MSNVSYELVVDLTDNDRELVGEVRIRFDLSDDSSDLTLDRLVEACVGCVLANDEASPAAVAMTRNLTLCQVHDS